ncbi:hypothetical protein D9758_008593 [Tetrapyrgos nigripes]|uniref:DUF6533 domain-containing protein n=1 Tax=Tetrapyrgos nigripes TaxID=182062 RepID=A0A8H5G5I4_9AGAR|nr:hypothetical protein D9758_008593 [Tetrapyrgos nigripes]
MDALLGYDILLNIDREKRLIWEEGFRVSTVLYYILRYPVIAFQIFTLLLGPNLAQLRSNVQIHVHSFYYSDEDSDLRDGSSSLSFSIASFIMRVYAILPKGIFCYLSTALLSAIGILSVALDVRSDDLGNLPSRPWSRTTTPKKMENTNDYTEVWDSLLPVSLQLGAVILYWGVFSLVLNNYLTPISTILVSHFLLDLREAMHTTESGDGTAVKSTSTYLQDMQFAAPSASVSGVDNTTHTSSRASSESQSWSRPERTVDQAQQRNRFEPHREFQFDAGIMG